MNKNLKRIVAMAIAVGTISVAAPVTNTNLLITKAYASTDTNDTDTLDSLKLENSNGNSINLYSDNDYASDNKVDSSDVSDGDTYYAKTSSTTVHFSISGPSSKYVKVFKGKSNSTKGKSIGSDISLSAGETTTLTVRVYDQAPDSSIKYDDSNDDGKYLSEYVVNVKCTASDSSDSSDSYDSIYLSKLSVDGESLSLSDSKTTYTYNVTSDVDSVPIKAVPEDDSYTVTIDGHDVDDSDNYKRTVDLDKGENDIKVEIQDDSNDDRVYTLKITRGSSSSTTAADSNSTSGTTTATSSPSSATTVSGPASTAKPNQWVQVNGGWQYNDSLGQTLKSQWFFDRNYQKWYYLGTDGMMSANCWIISGGKYYFLNADGTMATNTTISGYKVGADGAWIGR
jgi:hypothetical protein